MSKISKKRVLVVCPNPSIDIYAWMDDRLEYGVPNRISRENRYPGGKGLHVAMALAELGMQVTLLGFWGGEAGQWILKTAQSYYPSLSFAGPEVKEWSRSCYTFKGGDAFDDTEILGPGPEIAESEYETFLQAAGKEMPATDAMALCGSWPRGCPEDGYHRLITMGHQLGKPSFLDCTGTQLRNALEAVPTAIHLNRKELTDFFEMTDFEKAKSRILQSCDVAAITDGARGLHYLTATNVYHSLCKVDQVISTIGSGDCLFAGIIAGYVSQWGEQEIAHLGAACGAANCLREELGMLHHSDVVALLQQKDQALTW